MKIEKIIGIGKESIEESIQSLMLTKDNISLAFNDAVELLGRTDKIFVSGVGKSGIIARKISATFASIGLKSFFLHPVEALHGDIGIVADKDTIILLSKSGGTDELVRLIPFLKSRNVRIISIVGNTTSYLASNSDIVLDGTITKESCPFNIAPTVSTLVALAIGDALAVALMAYKNLSVSDFSKNHPLGQIGRNLTIQVKDVMHKNALLPLVEASTDFRDVIVEMTNKNLGCACVVDENRNLLGIITDGDVRRAFQKTDDIRILKANDVMTHNPISINQNIYLGDALAMMENRESQISVLPVIDDMGKYIGIIRIHDIVRSSI